MKMFFSGVVPKNDPRTWIPGARIMRAFGLPFMKLEEFDPDIFLDSGAFSLRKYAIEDPSYYRSSKFRDYIDQYAAFVKRHEVRLYANVDVIGDPKLTLRNQRYLEQEHGLEPIPVVHFRTPIEWVEKYVDEGYGFIGLGGLVQANPGNFPSPQARAEKRAWLDRVFSVINPNRTETHGFGVGDVEFVVRYPWWSVDSTAWVMMSVMGSILVPRKSTGEFAFDRSPHQVILTTSNPSSPVPVPIQTLGPCSLAVVQSWLDFVGVELGELDGETGVRNSVDDRQRANSKYLQCLVDSVGDYPHTQTRLVSRGFDLI